MIADDAFARALDHALREPVGAPLGALLHAPTVTAIVADPRDEARLPQALACLLAALERAGIPRGRCFVLLAADEGAAPARELAARLRTALAIPVIAHDPARSACFVAGRTREGAAIEVNDELREAEAIVGIASVRAGVDASRALIVDGLAPAGRGARPAEVPDGVAADLVLLWRDDGDDLRAWCGRPADVAADEPGRDSGDCA